MCFAQLANSAPTTSKEQHRNKKNGNQKSSLMFTMISHHIKYTCPELLQEFSSSESSQSYQEWKETKRANNVFQPSLWRIKVQGSPLYLSHIQTHTPFLSCWETQARILSSMYSLASVSKKSMRFRRRIREQGLWEKEESYICMRLCLWCVPPSPCFVSTCPSNSNSSRASARPCVPGSHCETVSAFLLSPSVFLSLW